jgi:hypothetical protein
VVQAVSKLLEALDYQVIRSPRTGKNDIDPVLVEVDLFAYKRVRALAVKIKTSANPLQEADWKTASGLHMAALALVGEMENLEVLSKTVEPLLVLVGTTPDQSLTAFSSLENVHIVEIPDIEAVRQILQTDDMAALREIAQRYRFDAFAKDKTTASPEGPGLPRGNIS